MTDKNLQLFVAAQMREEQITDEAELRREDSGVIAVRDLRAAGGEALIEIPEYIAVV